MARTKQDCPLEGKSLALIILLLVEEYGWKQLSSLTRVATFEKNPNFITNIKYLKKTPSARKKVEGLYLRTIEARSSKKALEFKEVCIIYP
jgi:uncharacterized protein (DUF2132 family)